MKKVLVVDDNRTSRKKTQQMLAYNFRGQVDVEALDSQNEGSTRAENFDLVIRRQIEYEELPMYIFLAALAGQLMVYPSDSYDLDGKSIWLHEDASVDDFVSAVRKLLTTKQSRSK